MAYGTNAVIDTLRSNFQTVGAFGEDRAYEAMANLVAAHNRILQRDLLTDLVDRTTDKERVYGTPDLMEMVRTDEFGRPDVQKVQPGMVVGFPLHSYQGALGWTRKAWRRMTVAEMTGQFLGMRVADIQRVILEVKRSLFTPTNYDFDDYLVEKRTAIPLHVRALANADGLGLPVGPNGEVFDSTTHTHYLATAGYSNANLIALLETVLEHYASGEAYIYLNRAQETATRGFADFVGYQYANIVGPTTAAQPAGQTLAPINLYDRAIGNFHGAEIWVKPWIPASYVFAFLRNQPKPLAMRVPDGGDGGGELELVADDEKYPLRCRTYERQFGVGVQERTNGAVLYTGSGTYAAPTLAD